MTYTELLRRPPRYAVGRPDSSTLREATEGTSGPPGLQERLITVHCAGRDFRAQPGMAAIFLRRALEIVAENGSGLVPLLHTGGIELLLITPSTAAACSYDGCRLTDILKFNGNRQRSCTAATR